MLKRKKDTWEEFEKRVGAKRHGKGKGERPLNVPNDINVQRMSSTPSGRLKKYQPLDTRDYVPFNEYDELTVENIKEACESFYNAPTGSCDILASDRGPSCTKMEQLKGKKVFFVRFLPPKQDRAVEHGGPNRPASSPASPVRKSCKQETLPKTVFPKSVSVTALLKAGKLIKPLNLSVLSLEYFDVQSCSWMKSSSPIRLDIEPEKFASGAFGDAFKTHCKDQSSVYFGDWVAKKYQNHAIAKIKDDLNMKVEDHTRKRCRCMPLQEISPQYLRQKFQQNLERVLHSVKYITPTWMIKMSQLRNSSLGHFKNMLIMTERVLCLRNQITKLSTKKHNVCVTSVMYTQTRSSCC